MHVTPIAIMRWLAFLLFLPLAKGFAQFDIGFAGGLYEHRFADIQLDAPAPQWSGAMFYRERTADHVDLGLELQLTSRRFEGALAPGIVAKEVELQYVHLSLFLEARLIPSGDIVVRLGPQAGYKISESFTGTTTVVENGPPVQTVVEDLQNSRMDLFQHDHRILAGLGFRFPLGTTMAIVADPYYTVGINRLVGILEKGRADEFGVRIGLSRRFHRTGMTHWMTHTARRHRERQVPEPEVPPAEN